MGLRGNLSVIGTVGLLVAGLALAPTAQAGTADIQCTLGSNTISYDPPMTTTPRTTTVSGHARYTCFSLLGDISSAQGSVTVTGEVSCRLSVDLFTPATVTYHWNTGQTSTVTYSGHTVVQAVNGTSIVTNVGTVTGGFDQGHTAVSVLVMPALSLTACATTGISSVTGPATLEILPV